MALTIKKWFPWVLANLEAGFYEELVLKLFYSKSTY